MISSVSNPRIFGSVCVCECCTVSLKSTLQTLLPKSLSLLLMCGECCLSALLFLSPSLSFVPPFVFLLFELQLLSFRHKALPRSLILTLVSLSKPSPLPFNFPLFLQLLYSFSFFVFCPCLWPSWQTLLCTRRIHRVASTYLHQSSE